MENEFPSGKNYGNGVPPRCRPIKQLYAY